MTHDDSHHLVFECSGRKVEISPQEIGIDPDGLTVSCGYDDAPRLIDPPSGYGTFDEMLSPAERREFADHVIGLWERWANAPAVRSQDE